jgi:AcrR family transcriptional regulator
VPSYSALGLGLSAHRPKIDHVSRVKEPLNIMAATKEKDSDKAFDKEQAREQLLHAAVGLFAQKGADTTLEEIIKEAKLDLKKAKALFSSADEILDQIIQREIRESIDIFTKAINDKGKADVKLTRLVRDIMTRYAASPSLFHILNMTVEAVCEEEALLLPLIPEKTVDAYRQATAIIGRLIAQGQTEGVFTDADPLEAAYLLRGMIRSAIFFRRVAGRDDDMRDHADVVMRIFLKGLLR